MKHFFIISLVLIYTVLSAFLEITFGGRLTPADLFLALLIGIAFTVALAERRLFVPKVALMFFPLLFVFLVGAVFAKYADRASFELLIMLFNVIGAIALANLLLILPEKWLHRFFCGYILAMGALALVCLIDFFVLPGLISSRSLGGIQGPFRNTGQAGSFFGVHAALACALLVGRVVPRHPIYIACAVMILFALVFTLKRASNLSIIVGVIAFVLLLFVSPSMKDKKTGVVFAVGISVVSVIGYYLFQFGLNAVAGLRWRLESKFNVETLNRFTEGFLAQNINSAFAAFGDRPIFGVGLGNVHGVYQHHEIHSTYLGILAYGGTLGVLTYVLFMYTLIAVILRESKYRLVSPWAAFLYMLLPLLIGQMVGWAYTLHIRKREFWLLIAFVAVAVRMSQSMRSRQSHESVFYAQPAGGLS